MAMGKAQQSGPKKAGLSALPGDAASARALLGGLSAGEGEERLCPGAPPASRTRTHKRTRVRVDTHTDTRRGYSARREQSLPRGSPAPAPPSAHSSLPAGAGPGPLLSPPPPLGPPGPDTVSVTAAVPFISSAPAPPRPDGGGREGGSDAEVALLLPPHAPPSPPVGRRARRLRQEAPRWALSAEAAGGAVPATFSPARGR